MPQVPGAGVIPAPLVMTDGSTVEVRQSRSSDLPAVRDLYGSLPETGRSAEARREAADRLCSSGRGSFALLALRGERVIGTAGFGIGSDPTAAGIEVAVAADFQGRGVEDVLLEQLARVAYSEGVTAFTAHTAADDNVVPDVFYRLGLPAEQHRETHGLRWRVRLDAAARYAPAADAGDGPAAVTGLGPLLAPRSLVIVGAGRSPGSTGRAVLRNLRRSRFPGKLYAVNPHAHAIERTPCYPAVGELPHIPDLAVLTVPAQAVAETAAQCGEAGIRALVVLTTGLEGAQGDELRAQCSRHGMRLLGPGSLGVANSEEGVDLDATVVARLPSRGQVGVAAQSGGVGIALLGGLARSGVGVSSFVSLGDKYDVSGNDVLQWWEQDDRTELALLHLESFGNPRSFSRTARRVSRRVPVLTVDAGRSTPGRRGAATHTTAAAAATMTRQALFAQSGVIATRSIGDLLGTAILLHSQPIPPGDAVAVVSNAGGTGVLAADACSEAGLRLPEPPEDLAELIRGLLPPGATVSNPVNTTTAVGEVALAECIDLMAGWAEIDSVLVLLVPTETAAAGGNDPVQALIAPSEARRAGTVVAVLPDQAERVRLLDRPYGAPVPSYADPQDAAHALAYAVRRSRWLARPQGDTPQRFPVGTAASLARVDAFLFRHPDGGWLDPPTSRDLLDYYGIRRAHEAWATDEETAVRQAADLAPAGTRVALKGYSPGLLHKRRRGAVHLDLQGTDQVRAAYREAARQLGEHMDGAVVQRMVPRGVDLVAGAVQDEVFGPLVLFGLGGTATDVLADDAARLAPLTDVDVRELLESPRCAPLLSGEAGDAPLDRAALEDVLLRLSQLVEDIPQLVEVELNPLVARPDGVTVVDCRMRLAPLRLRGGRAHADRA
jgi:acyl-CoA synthetase (NDP forming)/GNAT superfamily N-acetyltransferase